MGARRALRRGTFATLTVTLTAATTLTGPSAVAAQPDSVEEQIAKADADLKAAQVALADTYEAFTAAEQRYQQLSASAAAAEEKVAQTSAEATAATGREQAARGEFDEFASASYRHGSTIFSSASYLGANGPSNLLDRATMLSMLATEHGDILDTTQAAVDEKADADRDARDARDEAVTNRDAAANAKATAEQAYNLAVATQDDAQAEVDTLAGRRASLTRQGGGTTAAGAVVLPAQGRFTSGYGARGGTIHYGVDIANSIGTPIVSAMSGKVIDSGPASGFGLWVRVQHAGGLVTVYGHINESLVSVGQNVNAGQQIATIGNRGQSTGPHLHFEVHQDGSKIDPEPWLRSHGITL
jgi:murein DD-endopeptidase MepM/ murein hydrolase activator NlpD